jgi:hypothetical protein
VAVHRKRGGDQQKTTHLLVHEPSLPAGRGHDRLPRPYHR